MRDAALLLASGIGTLALVVTVSVFILRLVDRITLRPRTAEQQADDERRYRERLLSPHWAEIEHRLRVTIPEVLRAFYADHNRLLDRNFYVVPPEIDHEDDGHFVRQFEPADAQSLDDTWFPIGENRFAFASDDFGNYYFVEFPIDASGNLPVFYIDHDGGFVTQVANSFAEFISWKRCPELGS